MSYKLQAGFTDNQQLCELFALEKSLDTIDFWQDRSPDFFNLYDHFRDGPTTQYGLFQNSELIGTSGLTPVQVRWPCELTCYLDTDFIIAPHFRKSTAAGRLYHLRNFHTHSDFPSAVTFGIENGGNFGKARQVGEKHGNTYIDLGDSELTCVYLTSQQEPEQALGTLSRLKDVKAPVWEEFVQQANWFNKSLFLSPKLNSELLQKILEFDGNAKLYYCQNQSALSCGFLVVDMQSVRRFRWTAKASLVRSKFDRLRRHQGKRPIQTGDVFTNKVVSLPWWLPGAKTHCQALLQYVVKSLSCQGVDGVYFRGIDLGASEFPTMDVAKFRRKAFAYFNRKAPHMDEIRSAFERGELKIRLDSLFL